MNILKKISAIIDNFNIKVGKLFSWFLLFMVLLTCLIVILRYLFNIGFIWMQELVRFFYSAVFLICAAYTLVEDAHVRVDIFYSKLSEKKKNIINIFGSLFFLIPVCFIIFYYSFSYVINSWAQLEGSLEERGLHAVFIMKTFIWFFAFMLFAQGVSIIASSINRIRG
jgi:TRAP-type mannitol/chloroaromatic compound transport system permease small subunit|tara:strand:+ start:16 stop:519 length:504 start_codon:yes stop_codon:yes gene_type:complete